MDARHHVHDTSSVSTKRLLAQGAVTAAEIKAGRVHGASARLPMSRAARQPLPTSALMCPNSTVLRIDGTAVATAVAADVATAVATAVAPSVGIIAVPADELAGAAPMPAASTQVQKRAQSSADGGAAAAASAAATWAAAFLALVVEAAGRWASIRWATCRNVPRAEWETSPAQRWDAVARTYQCL